MIFKARTARPTIILNGTDYFNKLAPYFLSLTYTDNCDGKKADDLELKLADRDRRFISDWMPDKGAFVDVDIVTEQWFSPNAATLKLDCGRFWIDTIEFELPEHTVSVKATSLPTTARIKGSDETRGWEDTTLQDIANQIAGENNMSIDWQSDHNPRYSRVEQTHQSALEFLKQRALDAKLSIKVTRGKIIFFDEQTYEDAAPSFTIAYGNTPGGIGTATYRVTGAHLTTKLTDAARKSTVSHTSVKTGKVSKESYEATGDPTKAVESFNHNVNEGTDSKDEDTDEGDGGGGGLREGEQPITEFNKVSSDSSAQRKAKSVLRDKNKDQDRASIDLSIGNPLIAAGTTCQLVGFGHFDAKYFVESAHHELAPQYDTKLELRRCLKGY
jgi:uncharacterized protein